MAYKEKPLIDAGSKGLGTPDFFFSNPFFAGFFGMFVGAALGFFCAGIPGSLWAGGDNRAWFDFARSGSLIAMGIGFLVSTISLLAASVDKAQSRDRSMNFIGVVLAIGALFAADRVFGDRIVDLLEAISRSQALSSSLPRMPS